MKEEVKGGVGLTLLTFAVAMLAVAVLLAQGAQAAGDVYLSITPAVSMGSVDWEQAGFCLAVVVFGVNAALLGKRFMEHRWDLRFGYTEQKSFVKWLLAPWVEHFASQPPPLVVGQELKEFYEMLDNHSWHAALEYPKPSEDVIQRSAAEYEKLRQIAETSDGHRALFEGFRLHMFTGGSWTKGKRSPKPVLAAC